jgi:hypothetical protein
MPYYCVPPIEELKRFMKEVKANAGSKRQKEVADKVVKQFDALLEHAEETTKDLNTQEEHGPYAAPSQYWGGLD